MALLSHWSSIVNRGDINYILCFLTAKDCGPLTAPLNGSIAGRDTTFPNKVTLSCDEGFLLNGSNIRRCQANGNWSGIETSCKGKIEEKYRIQRTLHFTTDYAWRNNCNWKVWLSWLTCLRKSNLSHANIDAFEVAQLALHALFAMLSLLISVNRCYVLFCFIFFGSCWLWSVTSSSEWYFIRWADSVPKWSQVFLWPWIYSQWFVFKKVSS